jgi:hypothetical protein
MYSKKASSGEISPDAGIFSGGFCISRPHHWQCKHSRAVAINGVEEIADYALMARVQRITKSLRGLRHVPACHGCPSWKADTLPHAVLKAELEARSQAPRLQ